MFLQAHYLILNHRNLTKNISFSKTKILLIDFFRKYFYITQSIKIKLRLFSPINSRFKK